MRTRILRLAFSFARRKTLPSAFTLSLSSSSVLARSVLSLPCRDRMIKKDVRPRYGFHPINIGESFYCSFTFPGDARTRFASSQRCLSISIFASLRLSLFLYSPSSYMCIYVYVYIYIFAFQEKFNFPSTASARRFCNSKYLHLLARLLRERVTI